MTAFQNIKTYIRWSRDSSTGNASTNSAASGTFTRVTRVGSHNIAFVISYAILLEADGLANWFRNTFGVGRVLVNCAVGTFFEFTSFDTNIGVAETLVLLRVHQVVASVNGAWRDARMVIGTRWITLHGCVRRGKSMKCQGEYICSSYDTDPVSSIWWKLRVLNKRKHKRSEPCTDTHNRRPCRNCTYRIYTACNSCQQILPGDIERIPLTSVIRIFSVPKSFAAGSKRTNRLVQLELKRGFAGGNWKETLSSYKCGGDFLENFDGKLDWEMICCDSRWKIGNKLQINWVWNDLETKSMFE